VQLPREAFQSPREEKKGKGGRKREITAMDREAHTICLLVSEVLREKREKGKGGGREKEEKKRGGDLNFSFLSPGLRVGFWKKEEKKGGGEKKKKRKERTKSSPLIIGPQSGRVKGQEKRKGRGKKREKQKRGGTFLAFLPHC